VNETFFRRGLQAAGRETATAPAALAARPLAIASGLFILACTLLHLGLVFRFPLAPDETYYWQWARHLDWGYYDQGPMIGWWIHSSCLVFGNTPLGVRFGIVLAALATQVFLYLLARDLFGPHVALLSLIPGTLTPLALAGGFIATYDPLVVLFWAAAMYYAARALFFGSRLSWLGLGVSLGLGLLSKHTILLFAPCLLLFLVALPEQRVWLRRPQPWLALLIALILFAPNLWWQQHHDWLTFRHLFMLTGRGVDQPLQRRLGDFVGSQVGLITPLLFFVFMAALIWTGRRGREPGQGRLWYLFCMSAPVLLFFLLLATRSRVQANWAVCGWLTPPIAAVLWLRQKRKEERPSFALWYTAAAMAFCLFLSLILAWPETRVALHIHTPSRWDQMNKLYGGAEVAAAADRLKRAMEAEGAGPVALGAVTYDNASRLAFYMAGQPETCCLFPGTRPNSYALWHAPYRPKPGGSMLVVDDYAPDDPRLSPFRALFARVVAEPQPVVVYRRPLYSNPVHVFYLYRCYDYRPDPRVETPRGG